MEKSILDFCGKLFPRSVFGAESEFELRIDHAKIFQELLSVERNCKEIN